MMIMDKMVDVIVIGAGIAGSVLSKAMAERGWSTLLLDRQPFPRHKVCGEFLSPESQGMLARLGLLKEVLALSPSVITRTRISLVGGGVIELPLPGSALGVSRFLLDETLHQAAASSGAAFRERVVVTGVRRCGEGYAVSVRSGKQREELRSRSVIAAWGGGGIAAGVADGGASARGSVGGASVGVADRGISARGSVGGASAGVAKGGLSARGSVGVKMHYRMIGVEASELDSLDAVELYFFRGGYLGLNSVEDGKINVAALLKLEDIPKLHRSVGGMLEEAMRRHPVLMKRMVGLTALPDTAAAVSPVRVSLNASAWQDIPLVGDALCRIPPLCGDGMSMALRSAELCSFYADGYLRGELSLLQWERKYSTAIKNEFSRPLWWGRVAHAMLGSPLLSRALPGLARLAPRAARGMIRATRLRIKW